MNSFCNQYLPSPTCYDGDDDQDDEGTTMVMTVTTEMFMFVTKYAASQLHWATGFGNHHNYTTHSVMR